MDSIFYQWGRLDWGSGKISTQREKINKEDLVQMGTPSPLFTRRYFGALFRIPAFFL